MKAFSLIEVMIASSLLGIGLAAVMTAYGSVSALEAHQERVSAALHLAEGQLEELLLRYPDDDDLDEDDHGPQHYTIDGTPVTSPAFFQLSWDVQPGPIARTRRVSVEVRWSEQQRGTQTITLTTHRS
jgi:prepilin-type N-terminal cleavage/methylation domain-containing protein